MPKSVMPQGVEHDHLLWYKDAIIYQLHVRSFADGIQDGVGDFRGLAGKLDYLQDLGVTAIWLLPFYPSPLKDDGYDIADYTNIHPNYGVLRDFEIFLREAHRRRLRVITELVLNHTSDQHPWFQRARRAEPGSTFRDFYVWSDTPDRYREARIIFKDFEISNWTWDPVAHAYYWHRFYSHQPDLNFHTPEVREAMFGVVDFWMGLGVDGMRLDAVPYLFEREGTSCENLPETHEYLKELRAHVARHFPDRMFLAEANQWPEDAVAYFGNGDECHMAFHFPLMPRLFMAIRMEDRYPIVDILAQTPAIPDNCQWAVFLRNHDELTLEMVTDEERDYMYRVYAQDKQARINLGIRRRLAPLLENNRRRIELMVGVLFSLPGTPVIYYGDEIGMGDNIYLGDRNGVRTPMQWSAERNAGFSSVNPQKLFLPVIIDPEYHYQAINVEVQQANPSSLLWWMKRLIALRKQFRCFGRGSMTLLSPANHKVLALIRRLSPLAPAGRGVGGEGEETILLVANLARFPQWVELDLAEFGGLVPIELFSGSAFPAITERPYPFTLGPDGFYWFSLEQPRSRHQPRPLTDETLPELIVTSPWPDLLNERGVAALEEILARYLRARRGFGGKPNRTESITLLEWLLLSAAEQPVCLLFLAVNSLEGEPDKQVLPLLFVPDRLVERMPAELKPARLARLRGVEEGVLLDACWDPNFAEELLVWIARQGTLEGKTGVLTGSLISPDSLPSDAPVPTPITIHRTEQNNTIFALADQYVLKVFRRVEEGTNPELEVGRFLTVREFAHTPPLLGALEYRPLGREPLTLAVLHRTVPGAETAWGYTLGWLSRFFERALASAPLASVLVPSARTLLELAPLPPPTQATEMLEGYLESAILLGRRTAELHQTLASDRDDPAFAPEPFSPLHQRSVYQSAHNSTSQTLTDLRRCLADLPEVQRQQAAADPGAARGDHATFPPPDAAKGELDPDPHSRRPAPGPGAAHRQGFRLPGLRGRPRPDHHGAATEAVLSARPGHHDSLVPLLLLGGAAGPGGRHRGSARGPVAPGAVGQLLVSVGQQPLSARLPGDGRQQLLSAGQPGRVARLARHVPAGENHPELAHDLAHRPDWVGIPLRGLLQLLGS